MRPIHLTDLDAAVRALLMVDEAMWLVEAQRFVDMARIADKYRKRTGKPLLGYGTGTLATVAVGRPVANVHSCDAEYRRCLKTLLTALE